MKFIRCSFVAAASAVIVSAANAGDYNSQSSFVSAIQSGYYNQTFSSWSFGNPLPGNSATYTDPGNSSFSFTAAGDNGVSGSGNNLYSVPTAISTDAAGHSITFTFSNSTKPVTAFGGDFFSADSNANAAAGTVLLSFSDGHSFSVINGNPTTFYGYTSTTALTSVTLSLTNALTYTEATNVFVGAAQPAPEPSSLLLVGLTGIAFVVRSRLAR